MLHVPITGIFFPVVYRSLRSRASGLLPARIGHAYCKPAPEKSISRKNAAGLGEEKPYIVTGATNSAAEGVDTLEKLIIFRETAHLLISVVPKQTQYVEFLQD